MAAVSDLHKGAFWIYGVTAMVMREPLSNLLRHGAESGLGAFAVQEEALRVAVVLALMSRFFLGAGLFFDEVHLRPASAALYPKRSYPLDFLCGLLQLLMAVGASGAIAITPSYAFMIGGFLLFDNVWLAASKAMRLSTVGRVKVTARWGSLCFVLCGALWAALAGAGLPDASRVVPLAVLLAFTGWETVRLVRAYEGAAASGATR